MRIRPMLQLVINHDKSGVDAVNADIESAKVGLIEGRKNLIGAMKKELGDI